MSKGAFYIHFNSKEDLIVQQINLFYDELKLDESHSVYERLEYFLLNSIDHIMNAGLKLAQEWFSHSVLGNFYGNVKLSYDYDYIKSVVGESEAIEIISIYYGALNMWCFKNGDIDPKEIVKNYIDNKYMEKKE